MLVNSATLGAINTGFHIITMQNLVRPEDMTPVRALANTVVSRKKIEQYNWMSRLGRVREWIGPRVLNRFKAYGFTLVNKKWEDSVEVLRDDINDDALGQYVPQIQSMSTEMNAHYVRLLTAVLEAGFTNLAYDGQAFFDTDHPVGDVNGVMGTVSNKSTTQLSEQALEAAFTNLHNLRDDRGEQLGIRYDTLFIHPSQSITAQQLLESEFTFADAGGIDGYNRVRNIVRRVVELPYLTNANHWFLADTSKALKPLILQIRERPIWQAVTNMNDSGVFDTDKFKFGIQARHNAGYNLWQLAYGSTGADAPA